MEFPQTVREKIEELAGAIPRAEQKRMAAALSEKYRGGAGGKRVLTEREAAVYSAVRMPATFGAVSAALGYALEDISCDVRSLIDVGAGTGAAALAAEGFFELDEIICLERERAMRAVGEVLMRASGGALADADWRSLDITEEKPDLKADTVVSSYMLNELSDEKARDAFGKMWGMTKKLLLVVEPGTPSGYGVIKKVREELIALGAYIAAPCPHAGECPATEENWCHFSCRVARSRLHRQLKEGDAPYEDEKYTYIAALRPDVAGEPPFAKEQQFAEGQPFANGDLRRATARVMRHPYVEKGRISLELCTDKGFESRVVTARDKAAFRAARKAVWGGKI